MPWILVSLVTWLGEFFGKRFLSIAFRLAVVVALAVLVTAAVNGFLTILHTSLNSISVAVPDVFAKVWSWFMPSNTLACFGVLVSARIARFFFTLSYKMLNTKAKALLSGS